MLYRKLPKTDKDISILGLGMGYIHESSESDIQRTVEFAIESGINYFDMAAAEKKPYAPYARAFSGKREGLYLQMHFGANYDSGMYGWTRDLSKIKKTFEEQLSDLNTDYADMGFLHCIDDVDDYENIMTNGTWDYMKGLKEEGVIKHLGLSSHDPKIVRLFLKTGLIDMIMFSINPAYDYSTGKYGIGSVHDRGELYRECEKSGVGISVMKPFGGGQLLDKKLSPFKQALTKTQCIQYALDRPAVITVLPGIRGHEDLKEILSYLDAGPKEKDYSAIGEFTPQNADGICVYCNHCQPCPMNIDIGLINKYYDLAKAGDTMARGHYDKLKVKAGSCTACGHCESRCPFHVKQESIMREISKYFGK